MNEINLFKQHKINYEELKTIENFENEFNDDDSFSENISSYRSYKKLPLSTKDGIVEKVKRFPNGDILGSDGIIYYNDLY